jgi:two-component system, sensor histidine kinase and response regulator
LSLTSGIDEHIPKPINKKQLFDVMINLIPPQKNQVEAVATQQAKISTADSLPEFLNGINVVAGVQRLDGNHTLYRSLLIDFVREFATVVEDVRNALFDDEKEDKQTARRLVHSVKGMSGNLAAMDLHAASASLEKAIVDDRTNDWLDLMEIFTLNMSLVMSSIATLDSAVKCQTPHDELDINELTMELNDLAGSIQKKRFKAKKQLMNLRPKLGDALSSEPLQLLEASIDRYDFKVAWDHLQALATLLDITIATSYE